MPTGDKMGDKSGNKLGDKMDIFDNINPMDFRYYGRNKAVFEKTSPYLSERAMIDYMARVEAALTKVLAKRGVCSEAVAKEVEAASKKVEAEKVYQEEDRIKHNVRALANCIREHVSEKAKPFVHFTSTSHDIICTADAARFKAFSKQALVPELKDLEKTLIFLAKREKDTLQIGRTHGQHAEPITFGFAIAEYVSRFGSAIKRIERAADDLRGKLAGAVGAYNAPALFFDSPEAFEKEVLKEMDLKPSPTSTQVVEPEYMADFNHAIISAMGVLANLADDMRHLQRSEIAEVAEAFGEKQVGSSTMPHKRNPINFENVKSFWKAFMPRMITSYMDQISEHQRDLTNSATSRWVPELLAALFASSARMNRIMGRLVVDKESLKRNFDTNSSMIVAEPLYILLAAYNHPDAHEVVRELTLKSQKTGKQVMELALENVELKKYIEKFNKKQIEVLESPEKYTGIASKKAEETALYWEKELGL